MMRQQVESALFCAGLLLIAALIYGVIVWME